MLKSLGILTLQGEASRAGMLFLGKHPQRFEPPVEIKTVAFQGSDIGSCRYLDSRDIAVTIPRMFKEGMAFLGSYLRQEQRCRASTRPAFWKFPRCRFRSCSKMP